MSLCNTFRLFIVSLIIVLSSIDTPTAYTLRRTSSEPRDLAQEKPIVLEGTNENATSGENKRKDIKLVTQHTNFNNHDKEDLKNIKHGPIVDITETQIENLSVGRQDKLAMQAITDVDISDSVMSNSADRHIKSPFRSKATTDGDVLLDEIERTTEEKDGQSTDEPTTNIVLENISEDLYTTEPGLPVRKEYRTIERKRPLMTQNDDAGDNKTEAMMKAETKRLRLSLKDTVTSDIPSLEKLKNDLITSTINHTTENKSYETSTTILEENIIPPVKRNSSKWETVETMRAGYLDLSEKTTLPDTLRSGPKEIERRIIDFDSETESPVDRISIKTGSQSQLASNEDILKEELLRERVINENKENSKRMEINIPTDKEIETSQEQTNYTTTDKLSVKPINGDKSKNSSLYTVSPNYKPLKKIEVQPPKPFIRDPDDNSWRNESLSSLGIVFKPKNSSKPFTQVLKNKTESELNNLSEKDSKNDIPDLRERLQKMAEKRKSKKKKTDSFGNVIYFDYEENSNSVENTSKEEPSTTVSVSEIPSTTITSPSEESSTTTSPVSVITENRNINDDLHTTKKYKKFFNVPEYYDATEEDDTDYLNMAKIDIKKFSTSKKATTHTTPAPLKHTTPTWPMNRTPLTNPPERKGTIQYFPPLTTQKVSVNEFDNAFQYKMNSYTEPESPKTVLPGNPTTPETDVVQYKPVDNEKYNDYAVTTKPHYDKNLYLTQPPLTTQSGYTFVTDDGAYDRDAYVIRHYKDFVNMAAKNHEYDRNLDYIPYTQTPMQGVTKADVTYETEKSKVNMDEEYDYESQFRKDVLQRFVDNFNQNTDRYKSNFPVLFNNSVIHRDTHGGEIASSRAFMRGLYNDVKTKQKELCEPNCGKLNVDLSPAYELHYYVPEQEEKEEAASPVTLPYPYRL